MTIIYRRDLFDQGDDRPAFVIQEDEEGSIN